MLWWTDVELQLKYITDSHNQLNSAKNSKKTDSKMETVVLLVFIFFTLQSVKVKLYTVCTCRAFGTTFVQMKRESRVKFVTVITVTYLFSFKANRTGFHVSET
jgi:hypothetical protein